MSKPMRHTLRRICQFTPDCGGDVIGFVEVDNNIDLRFPSEVFWWQGFVCAYHANCVRQIVTHDPRAAVRFLPLEHCKGLSRCGDDLGNWKLITTQQVDWSRAKVFGNKEIFK